MDLEVTKTVIKQDIMCLDAENETSETLTKRL